MLGNPIVTELGDSLRRVAAHLSRKRKPYKPEFALARLLLDLADGETGRVRLHEGRTKERLLICAHCGDVATWAGGWLVWEHANFPKHDMGVPLCEPCSKAAKIDGGSLIRETAKRLGIYDGLRFEEWPS